MTRFDGLFNQKRRSPSPNIQTSEHSEADTGQPLSPDSAVQQPAEQTEVQASEHSDIQTSKRLNSETSQSPAPDSMPQQSTQKTGSQEPKHSDVQMSKRLGVQASEHLDAQASKLAKSKDPTYQRSTIYLPKDLHQRLKLAALQDGSEISEVIETLVADWLESRDR